MQSLLIVVIIALIIVASLQIAAVVLQWMQNSQRREIDEKQQEIYEGLGIINSVTDDVKRFKRLFENSQAKGALGEFVLKSILEQFLIPGQYDCQAQIKRGSERVDFAIKIPSNEDVNKYVYLPVDSKFTLAAYMDLMDGYDLDAAQDADSLKLLIAQRENALKANIKAEAGKIKSKYVFPPATTAFAILFLPNDKMFVEVLNIKGLFEEVYDKHGVLIAGPSTLGAFLSSLRMGFKHIALDKRSSDFLKLFEKIKKRIEDFDTALGGVHSNLQSSLNRIEEAEKEVHKFKKALGNLEKVEYDGPLVNDATHESINLTEDSQQIIAGV